MKKILLLAFTVFAFMAVQANDIPTGGYEYFEDSVATAVADGWISDVEIAVTGSDFVTAEIAGYWVEYPQDVTHDVQLQSNS